MSNGKAPEWFYERMAEVTGENTGAMSERELAKMCGPMSGAHELVIRAAAEIMRLRIQLRAIHHAAPASKHRRKLHA